MPVTLTIKQVPDELARQLRALAARNHRSIQGELMHSLERLVASQAPARDDTRPAGQVKPVAPRPYAAPAPAEPVAGNDLLAQLDAIVAGSHWGEAPLLSREQANDRALTREFEHLVQEREAPYHR